MSKCYKSSRRICVVREGFLEEEVGHLLSPARSWDCSSSSKMSHFKKTDHLTHLQNVTYSEYNVDFRGLLPFCLSHFFPKEMTSHEI